MSDKDYSHFMLLVSVFAVGPATIYGGIKSDNKVLKYILIIAGTLIILISAYKYITDERHINSII